MGKREESLEDPYQMIDFQTDYCVDLVKDTDYPKIDFELIKNIFMIGSTIKKIIF